MEKSDMSREDLLVLAKLSQQTQRFTEMVQYAVQLGKSEDELTSEQRLTISAAFKHFLANKKAELSILEAIFDKTEEITGGANNNINSRYIKNYMSRIKNQAIQGCEKIIYIIDEFLLQNETKNSSIVFYLKMKGDFLRYVWEHIDMKDQKDFYTTKKEEENDVEIQEKQFKEAREQIEEQIYEAYINAQKIAMQYLEPTNPIRLGLLLNFSIFYYYIASLPMQAINVAKMTYDLALKNFDRMNQEVFNDCSKIIQMLRDNITLWETLNYPQNDEQTQEN